MKVEGERKRKEREREGEREGGKGKRKERKTYAFCWILILGQENKVGNMCNIPLSYKLLFEGGKGRGEGGEGRGIDRLVKRTEGKGREEE